MLLGLVFSHGVVIYIVHNPLLKPSLLEVEKEADSADVPSWRAIG